MCSVKLYTIKTTMNDGYSYRLLFFGSYETSLSGSMRVASQRITVYHVSTTSIVDHHICHHLHCILHFSVAVGSYTYRVTQLIYEEEEEEEAWP